jgi:hypothetical protein
MNPEDDDIPVAKKDPFLDLWAKAYKGTMFFDIRSLDVNWGGNDVINHEIDKSHVKKLVSLFKASIYRSQAQFFIKATLSKT